VDDAEVSLGAVRELVDFVLEIVERHVPAEQQEVVLLEIVERHVPAEQQEVVLLDLVACAPALAPLLLPGWPSALRH
jgi:hypothetical protein